jgi:hypothetical protein
MDFSRTENDKITIKHFEWLGFKNVNGAFQKEGLNGEIQFVGGEFWFCQNNVAIKKIEIEKDINDIYLSQYQKAPVSQ